MASFAVVVGVPPACGAVLAMSAAAAKGEKKGLFDWLNGALDKSSMSETDPILQRAEGGAPRKPTAASKKASPPKKQGGGGGGGGFFGLGKK